MKVKFDAIKCTQNGKSFFLSSIPSDVLKKTCAISRRKENANKGFQRLLSESRAKNITQYLDIEKEVIPSTIILSAHENSKFKYDEKKKEICFEDTKDSMLIIDGQHRLYGLFGSKNIYEVPVVIFSNLDIKSEVKLFIDINTTQKGVPAPLLLDIKNMAERDTPIETRQRILFEMLDDDSVLSGYLLKSESKAGKISRTVFNTATKQIYEVPFFHGYSDEVIYKTVKNYLEAIQLSFKKSGEESAKIWKSIFFRSCMNIFVDTCEKVLEKSKNLKVNSFEEYVEPLQDLDFVSYTGSNNATIAKVTSDMKKLLQTNIKLNEDMF